MLRLHGGVALRYGARRVARNLAAAVVLAASGTAAIAEEITIAALGDSLTQGYGLPQEDGFVPQLEAWLEGQGEEVALINAGVSGDTSAGGLARVGWTLTPEVDAMIVALGGNDLLRGLDPAQTRANIEGILREAAGRDLPVLLVGLPAPTNYGPEFKAEFDALFPELAETYGAIFVDSFLGALGDDLSQVRPLMQSDGIHPNAEGVARIVADIGPSVQVLVDRAEAVATQ
ncbi:MAG: arylesterase [Pseudomonadota bacterium]